MLRSIGWVGPSLCVDSIESPHGLQRNRSIALPLLILVSKPDLKGLTSKDKQDLAAEVQVAHAVIEEVTDDPL